LLLGLTSLVIFRHFHINQAPNMPMHQGFLPREGFVADPFLKLIGRTVLNPALLLPLVLLARFTKKGQDLAILHPLAISRVKTLFYFAIARWLNNWYSNKALNNWINDRYDWSKEIVVVTGGAGGIGGKIVQLLSERKIKTVVLDIIPMTFETGKPTSSVCEHGNRCDCGVLQGR
jgi:all-trans-retinol dehydrogenase (NAD+)